jgi:hypothetical protein
VQKKKAELLRKVENRPKDLKLKKEKSTGPGKTVYETCTNAQEINFQHKKTDLCTYEQA